LQNYLALHYSLYQVALNQLMPARNIYQLRSHYVRLGLLCSGARKAPRNHAIRV